MSSAEIVTQTNHSTIGEVWFLGWGLTQHSTETNRDSDPGIPNPSQICNLEISGLRVPQHRDLGFEKVA